MASAVRLATGTMDWSAGCDSGRVTTVVSAQNPHGLTYAQTAWMTNCTVRGGGITQRLGYQQLVAAIPGAKGLFQGEYLYEPIGANPYKILSIGGVIWKVLVEAPYTVTNLSAAFNLFNPPAPTMAHFSQGESFLVIQAGDLTSNPPTLPLFWDGATLRRSNGVNPNNNGSPPATYALTTTAPWVIPAVGATVVIALSANYPGQLNDVGTWQTVPTATFPNVVGGTFQVTAIGVNSVTLKTVASNFTAGGYAVGTYDFVTQLTRVPNTNELPAAGPMVYYQGRIWYANGKTTTAGDIVGNQASGTLPYNFKDSVLKVTENPLAIGGDGFSVPDNAGDITALDFTANDNTVLGQGPLYVFTRKQIYALQVPVTRADWINAGAANQPLMTVVQRRFGSVGDRCVVPVNGDLFYQSLEPAIRSLRTSVRNDDTWLNPPVSRNENRVLAFNDRSLMAFATGIQFDNRLLQGVLPFATPAGVAFRGVIPLDFDIISSFGQEEGQLPPAWEGMTQGLNHLQLTEGDFGGRQRAFSTCYGDDGNIQIWELTDFLTVDMLPSAGPEGNRVKWYFETPAYDFGKIFELKRLDGAEIYIDSVYGTVEWTLEYRTDADNCWQYWQMGKFCSAKDNCEAGTNPDPTCSYPVPTLCLGQKFPLGIPKPQQPATCITMNQRPSTDGFQFQIRMSLHGYCRVRGLLIFALPIDRQPFYNITC